ncbi:ATP-binding protein [Actinophytocola oryzae]|uniref:DNA topoisomerase (ATP-hydrolyzing) n=1 Tax=Actinophytocola oryzae TaxID=502181 RepID=A0A4R7VYP6_9PSEU|nr:ATP-binding protein [Actinophytocola oryzae]TDV55204.1 intein/intein [Actinophytocola oryzae]
MTAGTFYGADDLTHLEGLEAVRKRPGMYIGSTDSRGINHLFNEVVDNSTDEGIAGHATRVVVTLHADSSVQVDDDGRGIPTGVHTKSGLSGVELVLTRLHAGGKFGGSGYKTSGGLHGVGASAVNALSHRFDVTVKQDGKVHQMSFAHGVPGEFADSGPKAKFTKRSGLNVVRRMKRGEPSGTSIRYWYDARYFENNATLDVEAVRAKLRHTAFLVPGVTYVLRNTLEGAIDEEIFHYPNGLADMVEFLAPASEKPVSGMIMINGTGTYRENAADENGVMQSKVERVAEVEVAMRWGTGYERTIECFTNTIRNVHGGTHRRGFDRAVVKAVQEAIAKTRGLLKPKEDPPTVDDVEEGMTAVVHVKLPEPQFTSQTKDELSTAGITKVLQSIVDAEIRAWTENRKTKTEAKTVLQKVVDASRVRLTQKQQKDAARRKTALEGAAMPPKLVDCRSTGINRSELFLVEGDSALGCFTGDTMVALASGESRSFADLAADGAKGITHFGYTTNKAGRVVLAPLVEPRLTKRDAPLVRVTLDNGESVRCTPDHLFRLRDGSYRRADELAQGDSLMPLYRSVSARTAGDKLDGYERVWMNDREEWVYSHYLADGYNLRHGLDTADNGIVRHHVDVDKRNNDPRSEQWQDEALLEWRRQTTVAQFADPAERERQRTAVLAWHRNNPEFGAEHSVRMKVSMSDPSTGHLAKAQAGRRRYVESVPRVTRVARQQDGRRIAALKRISTLLSLSDSELGSAHDSERLRTARTGLRFDRLLAHYEGDYTRLREAASLVNHAVVSVEALDESADVYDLTVDGYHNFALEAGVFVHNSARLARVSEYQALLPLRGKILNVQKASLADTLRNVEIASIVQVLGAGTGRTFDLSTMRYGRVILMADADVDGSHIRTLLITLFARYMRPVIEDGRLFAAMPPLHKITTRGRNPETHFTFTQREMETKVAALEKAGKTVVTPVPRFKGLGEMDAEELWDTTMNPASRSVRRITLDDAEAAEAALELLMGEKVEPRRNWLVESSERVDTSAIDI